MVLRMSASGRAHTRPGPLGSWRWKTPAWPQSFFLPQTHVILPTPHLQGCLKVHGVSFYGTFTADS